MDEIDTLKPWTVRGMPVRVSAAIVEEAHQCKVPAAAVIEAMWERWTQGPRPEPPPPPPPPDHDLIALLHAAAAALAAHTKIPREVRARINRLARARPPGSGETLGRIGHDGAA